MDKRRFKDVPIIEIILSLISTWWAIVFFNSPNIFTLRPKTYEGFAEIAPEYVWMTTFIVAAAIKIIGIFAKLNFLRKFGLTMSTIIYSFIAYCYFDSLGFLNTGFGTFAALSLMALWGIREVERTNV